MPYDEPVNGYLKKGLEGGRMGKPSIPGYNFGKEGLERYPITLEDLEKLKETLLITEDDIEYLRHSEEILKDQIEDILDTWYGFVGSHPFLIYYFSSKKSGQPDMKYLAAVRKRFGQWILDTARAEYNQEWLDYQLEIGKRHHRMGKNKTDNVDSVEHIPYRYIPALLYPITYTLKPFLDKKNASPELVENMHQAWIKSVLLQVILWSYPYVKEGDF